MPGLASTNSGSYTRPFILGLMTVPQKTTSGLSWIFIVRELKIFIHVWHEKSSVRVGLCLPPFHPGVLPWISKKVTQVKGARCAPDSNSLTGSQRNVSLSPSWPLAHQDKVLIWFWGEFELVLFDAKQRGAKDAWTTTQDNLPHISRPRSSSESPLSTCQCPLWIFFWDMSKLAFGVESCWIWW